MSITKEKLNELAEEIHEINTAKGFWNESNLLTKSSLIMSELYEMVEAHRKDRRADADAFRKNLKSMDDPEHFQSRFLSFMKDTIEDEIADAIIRCLDLHQYLYFEVKMNPETEHTMDYSEIEALDFDDPDDLHSLIIALSCVVLEGPEYLLKPLFLIGVKFGMTESDILFHIDMKTKFNRTRSKMHGKKY